MAITKIIKIKGNVSSCLDYITNKDKTSEQTYVTYDGCSKNTVSYIFDQTNSINPHYTDDENYIKAYHIIQSFSKEDNITPETANQIGVELMNRLFNNKYSYVCATHIDHDHTHNHILICASERSMTGRKINDNLSLLHKLQRCSDELCQEHGLSVIKKQKEKGKNYREWYEDLNSPNGSKKTQLRKLIDSIIKTSSDFDDFIDQMKTAGAGVEFVNTAKYGKVAKYRLPSATEKDRWHRGYNLGSGYSDQVIARRIRRRLEFVEERDRLRAEREAKKAKMTPTKKVIDKNTLKISSMIDTSNDPISSDTIGLTKWKNRQNAMRMQHIIEELRDNYNINYTDVKARIRTLEAENNRLEADIRKTNKSINAFIKVIQYCKIYTSSYELACEYNDIEDKESFYQKHPSKLSAFFEADAYLSLTGIDKQSFLNHTNEYISFLSKRLSEIEESVSHAKDQIKDNEQAIRELRSYQKEIDIYLGHNIDRDAR